MPVARIEKDRSEEALNALAAVNTKRGPIDPEFIQTELEASAYWQKCEREDLAERQAEAQQEAVRAREDRTEHQVTEGLEVVSSIAAGILGAWKTSGGFAIGDALNGVVGIASKAGSIIDPKSRPVRAAARAGKVFLHSEISMITRNLIEKNR